MSLKWMCRIVVFMFVLDLIAYSQLLRHQGSCDGFWIVTIIGWTVSFAYGFSEDRLFKR